MALKKYNVPARTYRKIITFLEKSLFNRMYDAVVQVNPFQEPWLKELGFKNIVLVPNGVSKDVFKKISAKDFVKKYGMKNKFVVGYLGRVQQYKGLEQVVRIQAK